MSSWAEMALMAVMHLPLGPIVCPVAQIHVPVAERYAEQS